MKPKTISISTWAHIQCGKCEKWFAIEDSIPDKICCCHCGQILELSQNKEKN